MTNTVSQVANNIMEHVYYTPVPSEPPVRWADIMFHHKRTVVWLHQYCKGVLMSHSMDGCSTLWDLDPQQIKQGPRVVEGSSLEKQMDTVPHELRNHRHLVPAAMHASGKGLGDWSGSLQYPVVTDVSDYEYPIHGAPDTFIRLVDRKTIEGFVKADEQEWCAGRGRGGNDNHSIRLISPGLELRMQYGAEGTPGSIKLSNNPDSEDLGVLQWTTLAVEGRTNIDTFPKSIEEEFSVYLKKHNATQSLYRAVLEYMPSLKALETHLKK